MEKKRKKKKRRRKNKGESGVSRVSRDTDPIKGRRGEGGEPRRFVVARFGAPRGHFYRRRDPPLGPRQAVKSSAPVLWCRIQRQEHVFTLATVHGPLAT